MVLYGPDFVSGNGTLILVVHSHKLCIRIVHVVQLWYIHYAHSTCLAAVVHVLLRPQYMHHGSSPCNMVMVQVLWPQYMYYGYPACAMAIVHVPW